MITFGCLAWWSWGPNLTCTVSLGSLWRCVAVTGGLADLRVCWRADRD
jgi:hypothetical protein